jgi:LacI family fructose operon transcriptional repressor
MTVSLALRNSREVSAATCQWLQRLAAARGYRPDPTIGKLMHHLRVRAPLRLQASICGLTQGWAGTDLGPDNYFARLTRGLRMRAAALGYAFSLLELDNYPTSAQLQRVLGSRGIEGLVLLPLGRPHNLAQRLDWGAFSTVAVTSRIE